MHAIADVNTTFVEDFPRDIYFPIVCFYYVPVLRSIKLNGTQREVQRKIVKSNFNVQCIDCAILKRYELDSLIKCLL